MPTSKEPHGSRWLTTPPRTSVDSSRASPKQRSSSGLAVSCFVPIPSRFTPVTRDHELRGSRYRRLVVGCCFLDSTCHVILIPHGHSTPTDRSKSHHRCGVILDNGFGFLYPWLSCFEYPSGRPNPPLAYRPALLVSAPAMKAGHVLTILTMAASSPGRRELRI